MSVGETMTKMMGLLLIRHALNDWVGERLAGWTPGVHLNDQGRTQASDLARRLAGVPLAAIYSSPLERTVETAHPLAEAHGLAVHVREGLGEARYGHWTGRNLQDLREEELWPMVQVYPSGVRFPGGESFRELQARMVAELDAIRDAHSGQIVAVISHSDPIKLAVAHYAGLPLDLFQRLTINLASVTAFAFSRFGPRLICLNYTDSPFSFFMGEKEQDEEQ
jgi:probable phosphomutase (TIGR03848 family)